MDIVLDVGAERGFNASTRGFTGFDLRDEFFEVRDWLAI